MANFTTESAVRLRFQVLDTVGVPSDLVTACIDQAHADLLPLLNPAYASELPEQVAAAECFLAGANLFRSLAAKDAVNQKELSIGGQRIGVADRFQSLVSIAAAAESTGWDLAAPYLRVPPERSSLTATDSVPVLGEE